MITGALILHKSMDNDEDVIRFWKHNLLPLFVITEIWISIYYVYLHCVLHWGEPSLSEYFQMILFTKDCDMWSIWYMPMILSMYLFLPFICTIVKKFSIKTLCVPMGLVMLYISVSSDINTILRGMHKNEVGFISCIGVFATVYICYILMGYFISEGIFARLNIKSYIEGRKRE